MTNRILSLDEAKKINRVYVESPFKGANWEETRKNVLYARLAVNDCLSKGEAPFASHLFYTQTGILDDTIEDERTMGILSGFAWGLSADLRALYVDFGISRGMEYGIEQAQELGQKIEERKLADTMDLNQTLYKMGEQKPFIDLGKLLF
jgi:hypothetical protein